MFSRDQLKRAASLTEEDFVQLGEWDNVVLYGQYILDRKLVRRRSMKGALSV